MTAGDRLGAQLRFLMEIDGAKSVLRRALVADGSRRENDAEHMWHVALFALVLSEYSCEPVDVGRVVELLLVHDLVEIDAGDTFLYDEAARATQAEREGRAADRLYGLLPADQGGRLRARWEEFEARATPEARFAAAVDRLQPVLANLATGGRVWAEHGVDIDRVLEANSVIASAAPRLWAWLLEALEEAAAAGRVPPAPA